MDAVVGGMCESVNDSNIEIWYRGYNSKYGSDNNHLLWLTDDISYARTYGNRVEEIKIDTSKLKPASIFEMDEICGGYLDYYDGPDEFESEKAKEMGFNCYTFYANNDGSYCMCLWDKSVIVKDGRRELSRGEFETIEKLEGFDNKDYDYIGEARINESPDRLEDNWDSHYKSDDSIAFMFLNRVNQFFVAEGFGLSHYNIIQKLINDGIIEDFDYRKEDFDVMCDGYMTGRYWGNRNTISFWRTPWEKDKRSKLRFVIDKLVEKYPSIDRKTMILERWDRPNLPYVKGGFASYIPCRWMFNGFYDMWENKIRRVYPENKTVFVMELNDDSKYYVTLDGDIMTFSEYYMSLSNNLSMHEDVEKDKYEIGIEPNEISGYAHVVEEEDNSSEYITLYHGVNRKGLEYNLKEGGFTPRVFSEGGPKAVWLSEKQYNYEFTFQFDIPKSLLSSKLSQLSNVDYIYEDFISFNDFNCHLVKTALSIPIHNFFVEINIKDIKLSKIQFRYFPDLGEFLEKEYRDYPNVLNDIIKPFIEENQNINEDIERESENDIIYTESFKKWFGDWENNPQNASKVVDEKGFPLVVHHGSPKFIGDKFNKKYQGKSLNTGEKGLFCTTEDYSWAERFSYPLSQGSTSFTVKLDTTKKGDILSGFLNIKHPLDFYNLNGNDWEALWEMACETKKTMGFKNWGSEEQHEKWIRDVKEMLQVGNHQLIKFDLCCGIENFGDKLKSFGYDGIIAQMEPRKSAKEYCFIEPNQFKSIKNLIFNPESDSIYEGRKKVIKNDKGEVVPEKCDKCGGDVVVQIHGEPIYICKDCGKYFGTMPFHLKENVENEFISPEEVDLSSFDIKKKLNSKFWEDGHLDSQIRMKLLDIADDFIDFIGIDSSLVDDIIMTGSLANFNWDKDYSDVDLHIMVDYKDVDENTDFVKQYFNAQKNEWNNDHEGLNIFGFPVELYVQDTNEKHNSSGIYSLERDKWLIEPEREKLTSSKVNKQYIKERVSDYVNKIDKLEYLYKKNKNNEFIVRKISEEAEKIYNKIKNERKKGFEKSKGKEINSGNIIYKSLRRNQYLEKIWNLMNKTYNNLNSLK